MADVKSFSFEIAIDGVDLTVFDDKTLTAIVQARVVPNIVAALKQSRTATRDFSTTVGGGASNGGNWHADGTITYSWKDMQVTRDGSVSVGGGASSGGNWNVGGSVTIHF
jgi:hypothetical protein